MRCINCQRLGHTKKWCKSVEQCRECSYSEKHEACTRKFCVNCQIETHTSYDSECSTFWKHKSVNYIRISRRCTTREAWRIFNDNPSLNMLQPPVPSNERKKTTYAQMATIATTNNETSENNNQHKINQAEKQTYVATNTKKQKIDSQKTTKTAASHSNVNPATEIQQVTNTEINSNITQNTQHSPSANSNHDVQLATANQQTNQQSLTQIQNSYSQIISLSRQTKYTNENKNNSNDESAGLDISFSSDDSFSEIVDENLTEEMIIQDITEGLGLCTPPRTTIDNTVEKNTPVSQLYSNFPQLNVIITPNTLKNTQPTAQKGKMGK